MVVVTGFGLVGHIKRENILDNFDNTGRSFFFPFIVFYRSKRKKLVYLCSAQYYKAVRNIMNYGRGFLDNTG